MNKLQKTKVNKKIFKILDIFTSEGEGIDEIAIQKISYSIKCYLDKKGIKYETLNLYTPEDKLKRGLVDIQIDGEFFPFEVEGDGLEKELEVLEKMKHKAEDINKRIGSNNFTFDWMIKHVLGFKDEDLESIKVKNEVGPTWDLTIFQVGHYDGGKFLQVNTPCATIELAQKCADELNKIHGENGKFIINPIVVRTS